MFHKVRTFISAYIRRRIKLLYHIGGRYVCPLCGYPSRDFAPCGIESFVSKKYNVIGAGRRNAACWKCGANDRERLVFLFLKEIKGLFGKEWHGKVLHLAPEKEIARHILAQKHINYICGDLFADGYKYPQYVRKMDCLCLPFPSGTFDLLICNHVLEHIEDDHRAMSEFYRVLKRGEAILQVPVSYVIPHTIENPDAGSPEERLEWFGQSDHVRIYGRDYKCRLEQTGFRVEIFRFPEETISRYGLNKDECVYICHK